MHAIDRPMAPCRAATTATALHDRGRRSGYFGSSAVSVPVTAHFAEKKLPTAQQLFDEHNAAYGRFRHTAAAQMVSLQDVRDRSSSNVVVDEHCQIGRKRKEPCLRMSTLLESTLMARRSNTFLFATLMLSLGLAIGGHLSHLRLNQQANALPQTGLHSQVSLEPLVQSGEHISRISSSVMPSAVHIQATRRESDGRRVEETGSGVFMRSKTVKGLFVITNNHVVRGAELSTIDLRTHDGREIHPIRVYRDLETDIAVLQVNDISSTTGTWGDSDQIHIGNFVLAIGSPFGLSQSVTMGIVSAKGRRDLTLTDDRSVTNQDFIQTDAAINPGNSGGPLIDMYGQVIGINTAIASNSGGNEGIGFSIPSNLAEHVFEQLLTYGRVRRAYLGVELDNSFTSETARKLGMDRLYGARVVKVYQTRQPTPAALAGVRPDDVIVSFNGIPVLDENHLINLVSLADIGKPVQVEVFRTGRKQSLQLQLTDRDTYRTVEETGGSFLKR
jgi:serine protease Do